MKKLLAIMILFMTLMPGCTGCKEKSVNENTALFKFYNEHDFESNYTIKTRFTSTDDDNNEYVQLMTFAAYKGNYARTLEDENGRLIMRSFNDEHTLVNIDENGNVTTKFIDKNTKTDEDIRSIITSRKHLLTQKPELSEADGLKTESYTDKNITYSYSFDGDKLKSVTLSGDDKKIVVDIISITESADKNLFSADK